MNIGPLVHGALVVGQKQPCSLYAGAERMWHRRWKAANMLHRQTVRVIYTQVFVQHGKDLVVENLELAYAVHHLLQRLQTTTHNDH